MPYKIRKVRGKKCYSVKSFLLKSNDSMCIKNAQRCKKPKTKTKTKTKSKKNRTFARCTTMKKAKAQIRLLNYLDHK